MPQLTVCQVRIKIVSVSGCSEDKINVCKALEQCLVRYKHYICVCWYVIIIYVYQDAISWPFSGLAVYTQTLYK